MKSYVLLVGLIIVAACGGDSGDAKDDTKGSSSSPQTKAGEKQCGKDTCKLPEGLEDEELCCIDPFAGGCGVKSANTCRPFPKVDDRCPPPDIQVPMANGLVGRVFGCCTTDNACGIDIGMGSCLPRTIACMGVPKDQVDKIQPQTCDGEPLPLPANCGSNGGFMLPGAAGSGS
jgi:hypothetical protein